MAKNSLHTDQFISMLEKDQRKIMAEIGNNSKNFFQVKNWEAQGFIDKGVSKWAFVKNKPMGQKILVRTGRLRGSAFSRVVSNKRVRVGFNAPYASYVNLLRMFIGDSHRLNQENKKIILNFMTKYRNVVLK